MGYKLNLTRNFVNIKNLKIGIFKIFISTVTVKLNQSRNTVVLALASICRSGSENEQI